MVPEAGGQPTKTGEAVLDIQVALHYLFSFNITFSIGVPVLYLILLILFCSVKFCQLHHVVAYLQMKLFAWFKRYILLLVNSSNVGQTSWSSRYLLLSNWCFWTTQYGLYGSPWPLGSRNILCWFSPFFRCNFHLMCMSVCFMCLWHC